LDRIIFSNRFRFLKLDDIISFPRKILPEISKTFKFGRLDNISKKFAEIWPEIFSQPCFGLSNFPEKWKFYVKPVGVCAEQNNFLVEYSGRLAGPKTIE